ncbi:uncharacterized protein LOC114966535 [Acropora millepora]|uniref:uncharacterized protein LOC114966535 n=1 Tax=Acropora millepora TaxID=45264 RepID=UPI001CF1570C|nr:uncharacterized protein LOC114966535 [Acropora millepora]
MSFSDCRWKLLGTVMEKLVALSFFLCLTWSKASGDLHNGEAFITYATDDDYRCKRFDFDPSSKATNDVHIQLRLRLFAYNAAVSWIESVSKVGFTGCVTVSGPVDQALTIYMTWIAFEPADVNRVGIARVNNVPFWTTGSKCIAVLTDSQFNTPPSLVFLTVIHTNPLKNVHDAASIWAEEVTATEFKVCLRELKNFDGIHENIRVNILALSSVPSTWPIPIGGAINFPNNIIQTETTKYSFCKQITFSKPFYRKPDIVTTAEHDKNIIDPENNAISEWTRSVTKTQLEVCLKDIQRYDASHDPITVNYMAIGYIDPCYQVDCGPYKYCQVNEADMTYSCVCNNCTSSSSKDSYSQQVCDSDRVTHNSRCELDREICLGNTNATWVHDGPCPPFVLERGRVALHLNTTDVECKQVTFKPTSFQSNEGKINVQTSINYFNSTASFVHDAAVTWVESVTHLNFKLCALKAGRAERLTPDNGLTFVDYIAIQESPAGAAAGHLRMPMKWWDGTTCETLKFEQGLFTKAPYVFITAEHSVLGQKHDAATLWVENISSQEFKACLREMQNFDGLHENITVNWIAYESLENAAKLNTNQQIVDFPNDESPKEDYHNAFCQDEQLPGVYSKVPTIIISSGHISGQGFSDRLIPEFNSIASWVEAINTTYYRLCVKEIHKPNGYDPVKVTTLIIGS